MARLLLVEVIKLSPVQCYYKKRLHGNRKDKKRSADACNLRKRIDNDTRDVMTLMRCQCRESRTRDPGEKKVVFSVQPKFPTQVQLEDSDVKETVPAERSPAIMQRPPAIGVTGIRLTVYMAKGARKMEAGRGINMNGDGWPIRTVFE